MQRRDSELIGVGDDHTFNGVVVVGCAPEDRRAGEDLGDARQAALGATDVAIHAHFVADNDALATE